MNSNSKIVMNTIVMYGRLAITMVVTLLSSRWVLLALGEEDFGIYNLVAGLLALLLFLNLCMSTATQRFLSFALGKNDKNLIENTFYYSCILHLLIGVIILFAIEIIGQSLLLHVLQVPNGKLYLALFCLHSLSVSTFATVICVPYNAILMSHEKMLIVAFIEIISAFIKLFSAIYLLYYDGERLKLYAFIMTLIPILQCVCYFVICRNRYAEARFKIQRIKDKKLFKELTSYAGWNLIGSASSMLRDQGVPMLLNSFYGVCMNAAYGIAMQVKGQLNQFSAAIVTAARPQIVKSEGQGNRERMMQLSFATTKITFLLLSMLAIPLIVEMDYVLEIWLKIVPEYTVSFTRWIITMALVFQFALGLSMPIESIGKIRDLQLKVGTLHFIVLPVGFILLELGLEPYWVLVLMVLEESFGILIRLMISQKIIGLNIIDYIRTTIIPSVIPIVFLFLFLTFMSSFVEKGFLRLICTCLFSLLYTPLIGYFVTMNNFERNHINTIVSKIVNKVF